MREKLQLYAVDVDQLFASNHEQIKGTIHAESEDYVLNVGEEQYIQSLEGKYLLDPPLVDTNKVYADHYETSISGAEFPPQYFVDSHKSYPEQIIVYHVPYSGEICLLRFRPRSFGLITPTITIDTTEQTIIIEIVKFSRSPEEITKIYQDRLRHILGNYGSLKADIESYNTGLNQYIGSTFRNWKDQIMKQKTFMASLGIPLKDKQTTPRTFSVPRPRLREKIVVKPVVHAKGFQPEPTLDEENYGRIGKIINDVGKNFERLPSVYKDKKEEDLRDHILATLDPNFEFGSATGETFNKSGKTDIQLRYDSSVVFIAECKIWRGEKNFVDGINQLLSYLTWRDSKTAYVVFIQNKDFSNVLAQVSALVSSHANFVKEQEKTADNWFRFILSLPSDPNKEVRVSVMLYHIPTD